MRKAVCVVLKNNDNKYLAVTRKDNHKDYGFPGGKVEDNETLEGAAVREVFEETGLKIYNLKYIHEGYDIFDYHVTCYTASWIDDINMPKNENETGIVEWVDKNILINNSCFSKYNIQIFNIL